MRTSGKPWYRESKNAWFVQINGKQVRLAKGKENKAKAKRKWLKLMADGEGPKDRWLDDCVEHYLATLAPKTHRTRKQVLDAFTKHTGKIMVGWKGALKIGSSALLMRKPPS